MVVTFPNLNPRVHWLSCGIRFAFDEFWGFEIDGKRYRIAPGFVSDGASVPWYGRAFVPRTGSHLFAAIVHDWALKQGWGWVKSNRLMMAAMRSHSLRNPVSRSRQILIYTAISIYGAFRTLFPSKE